MDWVMTTAQHNERIQQCVEAGRMHDLIMLSHSMSSRAQQQLSRHRGARLLTFLQHNNSFLDAEQRLTKLRLTRERLTLEHDLLKIIQFLSQYDDIHALQPNHFQEGLIQDLHKTYSVNRTYADAGCNFPEENTFYKLVACVGHRFYSIYDGVTEYQLHTRITTNLDTDTWQKSGFFVHRTMYEAMTCTFPANSALLRAPRALLRVKADGDDARIKIWQGNKYALETIIPMECLLRMGPTVHAYIGKHLEQKYARDQYLKKYAVPYDEKLQQQYNEARREEEISRTIRHLAWLEQDDPHHQHTNTGTSKNTGTGTGTGTQALTQLGEREAEISRLITHTRRTKNKPINRFMKRELEIMDPYRNDRINVGERLKVPPFK